MIWLRIAALAAVISVYGALVVWLLVATAEAVG